MIGIAASLTFGAHAQDKTPILIGASLQLSGPLTAIAGAVAAARRDALGRRAADARDGAGADGGPRLLLLDEPSTGLSPVMVERILGVVQQLRAKAGIAILLVEQMVTLTLQIADRAYVLDRGRVVLSGPARRLLDDPAVKASYLGRQEFATPSPEPRP